MKTPSNILFLVILLSLFSCKKTIREYDYDNINFKEEMRQFVINISRYSKNFNPDFVIIPQNGVEIVTTDGQENNNIHHDYLNAIDGQGQEDFNFGYDGDNLPTPQNIHNHLNHFLNLEKNAQKTIFITDYLTSQTNMQVSLTVNNALGYVGYIAESRDLDLIPSYIYHENNMNINRLSQANNFLYLLDFSRFSSKSDLLNQLENTNFDVIIMDLFFNQTAFTSQEINRLKHKHNGGIRKLIAYVSIGEAENYRYYWNSNWENDAPVWLDAENPNWPGNYKVRYWESDWQKIIYGNNNSYIKKVLDAGFDGAYLDIIDAFDYFDDKYNRH